MSAEARGPWPVALRQAGILLGVALAASALLWVVRPDRLPWRADPEVYALDLPAPLVSAGEAIGLYDSGSVYLVDTRPLARVDDPAIPGAFVIREATFDDDLDAVMDFLYPEDPLVLYGESTPLPVGAVAARFVARGYADLRILQGGLRAWRDAGGPLADEGADDE